MAGQPLVQRLAAFVLHDHVGGIVGAEIAEHAHDARMVETGERPAFEQEALQPPPERLGASSGMRTYGKTGIASGDFPRQVFLDRHRAVEVGVVGKVGDAKAAAAKKCQSRRSQEPGRYGTR